MKIKYQNLLLIAGTGRNTGKTNLACSLIGKFSKEVKIIGLKISPHFHGGTGGLKPLIINESYNLYLETNSDSPKDSSRMFKAGAEEVYYIESRDTNSKEAFDNFIQFIDPTSYIVCESPALRKYIIPGIFIIADSDSNTSKKQDVIALKQLADFMIHTDKESFNGIIDRITIDRNGWKVKR